MNVKELSLYCEANNVNCHKCTNRGYCEDFVKLFKNRMAVECITPCGFLNLKNYLENFELKELKE